MFPHRVIPRIGRYEIKSLIGAGGMGTLYLARDTNPNTYRLVALKLFNANLDAEDLRERFGREARSLAALNHSNVVNIYDSGEYNSSPYIVMEYVRGETLAEKIVRKAPMSIAQKLKLMTELCAGLAHAHGAGFIHRDIKPANLMVDDHGRMKLLDFGIARGEAGMTQFGQQVTQINVRIGTPGYMSPEQIEGAEIDGRSDLFAVGVVLYELISYQEAFSGTTPRQIENKVRQSQLAPLSSLVPGLDPELERIVNKALAKNPDERYANAHQFESALEHVRWRLGLAESTPIARATPMPANVVGRKTHESRAEAAYQRALPLYEEHAREAAKRYCIEALAEDPNHAEARALLHDIDPRAWVASAPAEESEPIEPTVVSLSGAASSDIYERTIVSTPRGVEAYHREQTIIGTQARRGSSVGHVSTPLADERTVVGAHVGSRWRLPPGWRRYVPILAGTALVMVAAIIAVLVGRWLFSPSTAGITLTVTRPTGGTMSASGINCGTGGSDCSVTLQRGASVEFHIEADQGFRFSGFTGDCAPGGRTVMNGPRTCGATFEEDAPVTGGTAGVELLTIAPPTGGTVVAEGIKCGTQGKECSTNRPRGSQLKLLAWADKEFTFQGFTGDCTQSGEILMTAPRTCGATFFGSPRRPPQPPPSVQKAPDVPAIPIPTPPVATVGPIAPPGNISAPAPPEPPTLEELEAQAKQKIEQLFDGYRLAYGALDFARLQRVYPSAPAALKRQFEEYSSMEITFASPPRYLSLDVPGGTATVERSIQQSYVRRAGGRDTQSVEAEFKLGKDSVSDDWAIASIAFRFRRR